MGDVAEVVLTLVERILSQAHELRSVKAESAAHIREKEQLEYQIRALKRGAEPDDPFRPAEEEWDRKLQECADLRAAIEGLREENMLLTEERDAAVDDANERGRHLQGLIQTHNELLAANEKLSAEAKASLAERRALREVHEELLREVRRQRQKAEECEDRERYPRQELFLLREENKRLEEERDRLQNERDDLTATNTRLLLELDDAAGEMQRQKQRADSWRDRVEVQDHRRETEEGLRALVRNLQREVLRARGIDPSLKALESHPSLDGLRLPEEEEPTSEEPA